ncbi:HD domain-containing protein [Nisaea sp.]|uniref:HD domain-containing protein n=1 Tax=Nisaea sp. TaxID=2024842 RepID=UPI003B521D88
MPSIANLSRFEHVLGVAHLAETAGFRTNLTRLEDLSLKAAALLHDWAITSFGHLVEEALQYVGATFHHEQRLSDILFGEGREELLGVDLQILLGRSAGLRDWAKKAVGSDSNELLRGITNHIRGKGKFGPAIAGDIDLDNIDNVYRMAFHMGLEIDKKAPERLSKSMVSVDYENREIIFLEQALDDLMNWQVTRKDVYTHLMLSENDFIGKMMILYATIEAYQNEIISEDDWKLVDFDFINKMTKSNIKSVREASQRWIVGELWDSIPLHWMSGIRPAYKNMLSFSELASDAINRPCFAYGIKDKRNRPLSITFDNGNKVTLGCTSDRWLLGIGSPTRRSFTQNETNTLLELACSTFGTCVVPEDTVATNDQASLF